MDKVVEEVIKMLGLKGGEGVDQDIGTLTLRTELGRKTCSNGVLPWNTAAGLFNHRWRIPIPPYCL